MRGIDAFNATDPIWHIRQAFDIEVPFPEIFFSALKFHHYS